MQQSSAPKISEIDVKKAGRRMIPQHPPQIHTTNANKIKIENKADKPAATKAPSDAYESRIDESGISCSK
jgi:hypothetical protein